GHPRRGVPGGARPGAPRCDPRGRLRRARRARAAARRGALAAARGDARPRARQRAPAAARGARERGAGRPGRRRGRPRAHGGDAGRAGDHPGGHPRDRLPGRGRRLDRRGARPLPRGARGERAARGEQGAVAPLARPITREVARLSEAVATMARTLEERADYIRTFASQVSHEFKAPLTAIQGAVELLRDHAATMSAEERDRFLENLAADAQRLERLVRRLLELARAYVAEAGHERADLAAVLAAIAERHRR